MAKSDDVDKTEDTQAPVCPIPWYRSHRYYLAVIAFLGCIHVYAQRVGVSIAIVCMVNQTAVRMVDDTLNDDQINVSTSVSNFSLIEGCGAYAQSNASETMMDGPFVWEKHIQGHILGSFFYGYLVSQVPGGLLAERFGGKWVMASFVFLSTVATLLSPIGASINYIAFIALRVLAGIGSGAVYPAMHAIWSQWAPPHERSKLTNISYAGSWMGSVIAMPLSGLLCKYGFAGGWGSIFYVIGISSVLWIILWCALVSDTPAKNKMMKEAERNYITKCLAGQISEDDNKDHSTPWLKILTSGPVWAIIIGGISVDWGLYTFLTQIPTYFSEVLLFDVQANGFFSALPFLGMWVSMSVMPFVADKLISSKRLSIGHTRKLFQCIGAFGAALFLIILSFLDCSQPILAVALLTIGVAISGCQFSGFLVNCMDIAPNYAGTIFGIANGLSAICGFVAPYTVAVLTTNRTREEWQRVFFVTAGIYAAGALLFCLLGRGELQPWAVKKSEKEENGVLAVREPRPDDEKTDDQETDKLNPRV